MARFTVVIHPRLPRELKAIERAGRKDVVRRVLSSLRLLEEDPFQARPGLDIKQLAIAGGGVFRLRVGDYRLLYEVDAASKKVFVTAVFHRGRGYRE
ncbi:MAG TPA: type II toxin-antitoxin system RelE/ParE family toxin [Thermoplasmata archaeon]|nr:type II toxin-antitoxin system RelE/ParE family toxin [Thermoplasmata archaeon]